MAALLLWINAAAAQDFEGRLVYKQTIAGQESKVTVFVRSQEALVKRGDEKPVFYLVSSTNPVFQAWSTGSQKADQGNLPNLAVAKSVKASGSDQVIAGFKASPIKLELPNGQTFTGWYTPDVAFDHNQLLARIQGAEWGQLPAKGLLLRWEVSSSKGGKLMSGELVDHKQGKQDPE